MVDVHAVIRDYLLARTAVLVGTRVYAGRDVPPVTYSVADGACITFRVRGGLGDYEDALLSPSVQVKCYAATEQQADVLYRAVDDALQDGRDSDILWAQRETLGQPLEEPQTEWRFVLGFYRVMVRQ